MILSSQKLSIVHRPQVWKLGAPSHSVLECWLASAGLVNYRDYEFLSSVGSVMPRRQVFCLFRCLFVLVGCFFSAVLANLPVPSSIMLTEPSREESNRDVPFVAQYSTGTYSLHLDQLRVSMLTHCSLPKETSWMKSKGYVILWVKKLNLESNLILYPFNRFTPRACEFSSCCGGLGWWGSYLGVIPRFVLYALERRLRQGSEGTMEKGQWKEVTSRVPRNRDSCNLLRGEGRITPKTRSSSS